MCVYLAGLGKGVHAASIAIGTRADLGGLIASVVTLEAVTALAAILAGVADSASVSVVDVDTAENTAVDSSDVVDDDVSGTTVTLAVSTVANQLAVVLDVKVRDIDGTAAVELDNLVGGVESTATLDEGGTGLLLESNGVLADVLPPDVLDGAGALAVNTLSLSGTDDDVADGGTVLENEHGIGLTSLALVLADGRRSVVSLHATVKRAADGNSSGRGDLTASGGDAANDATRSAGARAGTGTGVGVSGLGGGGGLSSGCLGGGGLGVGRLGNGRLDVGGLSVGRLGDGLLVGRLLINGLFGDGLLSVGVIVVRVIVIGLVVVGLIISNGSLNLLLFLLLLLLLLLISDRGSGSRLSNLLGGTTTNITPLSGGNALAVPFVLLNACSTGSALDITSVSTSATLAKVLNSSKCRAKVGNGDEMRGLHVDLGQARDVFMNKKNE